ncbi:MAG: hypothetical protein ACRDTG_12960 [Pseudonocardiaceae bacterium]
MTELYPPIEPYDHELVALQRFLGVHVVAPGLGKAPCYATPDSWPGLVGAGSHEYLRSGGDLVMQVIVSTGRLEVSVLQAGGFPLSGPPLGIDAITPTVGSIYRRIPEPTLLGAPNNPAE